MRLYLLSPPCAVLVELEAFASPLTLSQINLAGIPVIALTSHEGLLPRYSARWS